MVLLARTCVSTEASADEVVQDTWLAGIRGIERFEGRSSLRTWV
jgi:RNA polymerase sigma-70 factor (ECF subfamily)